MFDNDNLFFQNEKYSIYKCNINNLSYYLSMPNIDVSEYQMFIGLPTENIINLENDKISDIINNINNFIPDTYINGILVLPCIKDTVIEEAAYENDRRLYTKLFNKIHAITNDVYNKFTENNIKLKEKIFFIKQNDNDSKFIDWLEINMNGFIESIDCKKKQIYFVNDTNQDDDSSITNNNNNTNSNGNDYNNVKIKKLTSKKKNSGFSTFSFIIFVLITSIFLGINIASLFIK